MLVSGAEQNQEKKKLNLLEQHKYCVLCMRKEYFETKHLLRISNFVSIWVIFFCWICICDTTNAASSSACPTRQSDNRKYGENGQETETKIENECGFEGETGKVETEKNVKYSKIFAYMISIWFYRNDKIPLYR